MSEVSTWNATDNANTATPPDGWPEGMQPAAVNDTARMMMGALRREHDRVTAQIGSVAGTISTTTINTTTVNATGAITASGPITGSAINSTGNASVSGTLTASNVNTGAIYFSGSPHAGHSFMFDWDGHVQMYVDSTYVGAIGDIFSVSAGNGLTGGGTSGDLSLAMSGSYSGNLTITGDLFANGVRLPGDAVRLWGTGRIDASGGDQWIGPGGSGRIMQMASGWYWDFNPGTGDLVWGGPSGAQFWVTRFSDHYCGNQIGPVFGTTFITTSDVRGKTDVEPASQGLIEILQLKPVTFKRTDQDRTELGFTAQDVQQVIPEAVWPLVNGDGADRLGVSLDPIVAVLVKAVQQLVARVEHLEAGGGTHV